MLNRSEARELALLCLHQWDQQTNLEEELRAPDSERAQMADALLKERASQADAADYARLLLRTYWEHGNEIDGRIESAAEHWALARMAVVDRNILRLAVTEMTHVEAVPGKVSVDEAIELAKKYSTEKSGSFVNGILDKILGEGESSNGTG